jgi:hypothetical protein
MFTPTGMSNIKIINAGQAYIRATETIKIKRKGFEGFGWI